VPPALLYWRLVFLHLHPQKVRKLAAIPCVCLTVSIYLRQICMCSKLDQTCVAEQISQSQTNKDLCYAQLTTFVFFILKSALQAGRSNQIRVLGMQWKKGQPRCITETNMLHLVLFGIQSRKFGPYLAAMNTGSSFK
jgi:hypothetical protein